MVREAIDLALVEKVYVSSLLWDSLSEVLDGCEYEIVLDKVFREMSDTVTPQGVLALLRIPSCGMDEVLHSKAGINNTIRRWMILEDIQDPGNLGPIFRTAEAAGYNGLLLSKGTVDVWNPKVVRSTMGAILRMPIAYGYSMEEILETCKTKGISIYGACLDGMDIREISFQDELAVVIGNESKGLSSSTIGACDVSFRIPMAGSVESLNASVAAGIIMYMSSLSFL